MKTINSRKEWFSSKKEALAAHKERVQQFGLLSSFGVYRQKQGRHKGQYFVGTYIDFINRY